MTTDEIKSYIYSFDDYDIRKTHDCRYVDQKCTPDIVCFISDCILSSECANEEFTVQDLWHQNYFVENCRVIFGKPSPDDPKTKNEYNKVLVQPLKLLAYAHVLDVRKDRKLYFKVRNKELLEYISIKERNAFNFLLIFFKKVLEDSGFLRYFEQYEQDCIKDPRGAKATIYEKYHRFIAANTPTKKELDATRMFHKVFNLFAYSKGLPGSDGEILEWYDLMYNRVNWRDKDHKQKSETRKESKSAEQNRINQEFYITYNINKAIKLVRKMQGDVSEVHSDDWQIVKATEVHHIFPRSKFPTIATRFENLILLTSSQHHTKAHPNGNTQLINKEYQLICLLAKSNTIENYIKDINKGFYQKDSFIYVINTGLPEEQIDDEDISFDGIRKYLIHYYQAH